MAEPKDYTNHIVMFPFMAYGHLNPFMALAGQIARRKDYTVTLVNTPLNIRKFKSSLPPQTNIRLAEIPFDGTVYGLPPCTENTDSLTAELLVRFLLVSENLEDPFRKLIGDITERERKAPLCIISDMFLGWTVKVAHELGIFHSVFIAGCGYSMGAYFSLSLDVHQSQSEDEFVLLDFPEASKIHPSRLGPDLKNVDDSSSWVRFRKREFSLCLSSDAILLNNIKEMEQIGAKYFSRKMGGKPVWTIGPACNFPKKEDDIKKDRFLDDCFAWMDLQPQESVLYVCFGSQNSILPWQMMELAKGLEASGIAFIWVIRPPIGFSVTEEFRAEWLPEDFEERMKKKQGILLHRWAPQLKILSHRSTGAFLSHCGWNSVIESLSQGVPIIGWPLHGEQYFNSHMMDGEVGVCLEVAPGFDSAEAVTSDHIAKAIQTVMGPNEKREGMRRKAREFQKKMEDAVREEEGFKGSSVEAMDKFLSTAILANKKRSVPSEKAMEFKSEDAH